MKERETFLNYNFECDWLIQITTLNVIGLLNCPITNCPISKPSDNKLSNNKLSNNKPSHNNLASELVENRSFLKQSQSRKL